MRRRRAVSAGPQESRIPTSMIDVVFLLLAFFIATLHFRVLAGRLETQLPTDEGGAGVALEQLLEPLELTLLPDASESEGFVVRIGLREAVDVAALRGRIASALALQPELRTRIRALDGIVHGQVVSVLDACLAAGLSRVTFAAT